MGKSRVPGPSRELDFIVALVEGHQIFLLWGTHLMAVSLFFSALDLWRGISSVLRFRFDGNISAVDFYISTADGQRKNPKAGFSP